MNTPSILSKDLSTNYVSCFSSDDKLHDSQTEQRCLQKKPFVSILVASYNESNVIDRLMTSFSEMTYGLENFEVIVVDDSNDGTLDKLEKWLQDMPNLKVLHRNSRKGWKGGALNLGIQEMDRRSSLALIVDADHMPEKDLLQKFTQCFASNTNLVAVQGFPIPSIGSQKSWVSRGIFFRLARRNLIEFIAKEKMKLPLQITGSVFMIRAAVLQRTRFSHDLTEDWELTLAIHLQDHGLNSKEILFHPSLISYCEAPSRLLTYFRQRSRISEGHTRGFKKRFSGIIRGPLSIKEKVELLFTGMQYVKFLLILALFAVTCARLFTDDIIPIGSTLLFVTSLAVQTVALSIYVGNNILSTNLLSSQNFNYKDMIFLVVLNVCTFSAFVIGSLRGLLTDKGTFYKTERSNQ
jgi:cellulose synthase/poly-beta-1,6-N-acetylglucosamine synthase-like glycosyltransferase